MIDQREFQEKVVKTFDVFRNVFLPQIKITSKELLEPAPMKLYRAQDYFLNKVQGGLENDVHTFLCLKARQLGISTVMLPLDIFWLYTNPGLQGALILDSGDNKEIMRETITQMLDSLPKAFKVPIRAHNRNALMLANGSRLQYMAAGRGRNSSLGRSRSLNFVHASECSSWGDQKGLDSLRASLAQEHPNRLYIYESTALGQNLWFDMCKEAEEDPEQGFFFIGWWMKDTYRIKEGTEAFAKWWSSQAFLSEYEQETSNLVQSKYGHLITPEQWAWYRREAYNKSEESLQSEFPSTEVEAWVTTGFNFFNNKRINEDSGFVRQYALFKAYNFSFNKTFSSLEVKQTLNSADPELRVWEEPKKGARYVIGMDVAYGLSETNDRTVISVWRCFADKLVQVAEAASSRPETDEATYMLAWLAGCYQDVIINLEINGPGMQVFRGLKDLKNQIRQNMIRDIPRGLNTERSLDTARWFLWHRPDSMGAGYCYNFKMQWDNKMYVMNLYRDTYNTEQLLVRSVPLLAEMTTLKQEGDAIQASGRNKDDRVIAAALACYAWSEWVRPGMITDRRWYKSEMATQEIRERSDKVIDHIVPAYFEAKKTERNAAAWARALSGDV